MSPEFLIMIAYTRFGDIPLNTKFWCNGTWLRKVQRQIAENPITGEHFLMTWERIELESEK